MFFLIKRQAPKDLAQGILRRLSWDEQWALRQALAGDTAGYYGDGGTIHHSTALDVETHHGTVNAVWFRCMPLAFTQHENDAQRATEMERMYGDSKQDGGARLLGVEVVHEPRS